MCKRRKAGRANALRKNRGKNAFKNEFSKSVNEKPVYFMSNCFYVIPSEYARLFTCCIIKAMTRRTVISRIRKHRAELAGLGVKSLSIFGSVARGEDRPGSDVDILVEFKVRATFDRYMDTKFYLEELLDRKVDLVTPKAIKPRMKPYIMQDLIHVA
jgi:uncharacterized protein